VIVSKKYNTTKLGKNTVEAKLQPKPISIAPKLDIDTKKLNPSKTSTVKKEMSNAIVIKTNEKSKQTPWVKDGKCYHKWFEWGFAQQLIQYACDVSNYDVDFILTLNAEMGSWNWQGRSRVIQKDWNVEPSFWMCQVHYKYHKKTIYENLPFNRIKESKFLTDWKYQIETCYQLYKWGTKMYGYNVRYKVLKGLIFINWQKY